MDKPHCWCDQPELTPFNEDYLRCLNCRTLIGRSRPESAAAFYGRHYWTTRQTDTLGHPDIHQRARLDLSDRAIYWLKTLLAYKRPPGTTAFRPCYNGPDLKPLGWNPTPGSANWPAPFSISPP
jgi:hypothetical protein